MDLTLKVEGMMCPHCKARVEKVCKVLPGATDAIADLLQKNVIISGTVCKADAIAAITNAGFQVVEV